MRNNNTRNIPFLEPSNLGYESMCVGFLKYSSLMGIFPLPAPNCPQEVATINMISTMVQQSSKSYDPWVVPRQSDFESLGDTMPLSLVEVAYDVIHSTSYSLYFDDHHLVASYPYSLPS
jgi:hypothetical protein